MSGVFNEDTLRKISAELDARCRAENISGPVERERIARALLRAHDLNDKTRDDTGKACLCNEPSTS